MKQLTGGIDEHLIVESRTTLTGFLSAGATVRAGQLLVVHGTFSGPLTLENDAYCTVYGLFDGTIEPSEGLAMLYGVVDTPPSEAKGKLAVGISSLVRKADGKTYLLLADGSLEESSVEAEQNLTLNGGALCVYLADTDEFSPVELDAAGM